MSNLSAPQAAALLGEGFAAWFAVTPGPVTSRQVQRARRIAGHAPPDTGLFWAVWLVKPGAPGARTPYAWGLAQTRAEVIDHMEAEAWVTLRSTAPFGELDPSFAEAAFRLHETDGPRPVPEIPFGPKSVNYEARLGHKLPPQPAAPAQPSAAAPARPSSPEVETRVVAIRRELRRRIALDRLHPDQGGDPAVLATVVAEYEARIAAARATG